MLLRNLIKVLNHKPINYVDIIVIFDDFNFFADVIVVHFYCLNTILYCQRLMISSWICILKKYWQFWLKCISLCFENVFFTNAELFEVTSSCFFISFRHIVWLYLSKVSIPYSIQWLLSNIFQLPQISSFGKQHFPFPLVPWWVGWIPRIFRSFFCAKIFYFCVTYGLISLLSNDCEINGRICRGEDRIEVSSIF